MAVYTKDMENVNYHKDVSNHYVKNEVNRYTEAYMKYRATMRKFEPAGQANNARTKK